MFWESHQRALVGLKKKRTTSLTLLLCSRLFSVSNRPIHLFECTQPGAPGKANPGVAWLACPPKSLSEKEYEIGNPPVDRWGLEHHLQAEHDGPSSLEQAPVSPTTTPGCTDEVDSRKSQPYLLPPRSHQDT